MKRFSFLVILVIVLSSGGGLSAQHYLGVRGGLGGGTARFAPTRETGSQGGLPSGGVSYKFYSNVKYVGAIQVDLQYLGRGYMYDEYFGSDLSYHRTIGSIDMPFMWQPHIYMFRRNARVFVNLGVNLTYNIGSKDYWESKENGPLPKEKYPFVLTRDNRWGYGLVGGAGLSFFIKRFEVAIEGRYYFGYSDILKNRTKYETNPLRSPLDNVNISIGFYYRLNKEGIRSAPSAGTAARLLKIEEANYRASVEELQEIEDTEKNGNGIDTPAEDRPADTEGHQ